MSTDHNAPEVGTDHEAPEVGTDESVDATGVNRRWLSLLVAVLFVGSAGAMASAYWWMYRPDQLTNAAAQQQASSRGRAPFSPSTFNHRPQIQTESSLG